MKLLKSLLVVAAIALVAQVNVQAQQGASNTAETRILAHYTQNADHANIGDAAGLQNSSAADSLYIALFTSSSSLAALEGNTVTNETDYTGYTRKSIVRSATGWTVANDTARNAATVTFGSCTEGTATLRYFGVFTAITGGDLLFFGQLGSDVSVSNGVQPLFNADQLRIILN